MTAPELQAFHLGIVVHDLEATIERYRAMLGVELWKVRGPSIGGIRIAYGRGGGQTWELVEVRGQGSTQFHQFRDSRGEGVHHVGFWTPDVKASVRSALDAGAQLVSVNSDDQGNTVVELLPGASVTPHDLENLGRVTFAEAGLGGVRMEYIGRAGETSLREWLANDFENLVEPPILKLT